MLDTTFNVPYHTHNKLDSPTVDDYGGRIYANGRDSLGSTGNVDITTGFICDKVIITCYNFDSNGGWSYGFKDKNGHACQYNWMGLPGPDNRRSVDSNLTGRCTAVGITGTWTLNVTLSETDGFNVSVIKSGTISSLTYIWEAYSINK